MSFERSRTMAQSSPPLLEPPSLRPEPKKGVYVLEILPSIKNGRKNGSDLLQGDHKGDGTTRVVCFSNVFQKFEVFADFYWFSATFSRNISARWRHYGLSMHFLIVIVIKMTSSAPDGCSNV